MPAWREQTEENWEDLEASFHFDMLIDSSFSHSSWVRDLAVRSLSLYTSFEFY